MLRLFVLLTSLFLINTASLADEASGFSWTGFGTYTAFSNQKWYENDGTVAINLMYHYNNFALKAQIATENVPIRRLALEYSLNYPRDSYILQLGRLPRLNTFFSDVYGNPDEWDMAVLPMATYNRRMIHSLAFNAFEGIKLENIRVYDWGSVKGTVNYGTSIQEYPCEWQMEATRRVCNKGWMFDGKEGRSYDVALETNIGQYWTVLLSQNRIAVNSVLLDPTNRVAVLTTRGITDLDYYFTRIGLRYTAENWYVQTEHGESLLKFKHPLRGWYTSSTAWDDYYLLGWYYNDDITLFGGYSVGHDRTSPFTSRDRFIGANYRHGRWSHSAELHHGQGSWQRHGSVLFDWDTQWVVSTTVNF